MLVQQIVIDLWLPCGFLHAPSSDLIIKVALFSGGLYRWFYIDCGTLSYYCKRKSTRTFAVTVSQLGCGRSAVDVPPPHVEH